MAELIVFDAYGTLFDVAAAARRAAAEPGQERLAGTWPQLAAIWRDKQVGYSWWRTVVGAHAPFWQVTEEALDFALEATGLSGDDALRERLLALYRELDAYDEVPAMLDRLKQAGKRTAILSNGSPDMLRAAVAHAGIGPALDAVLSVETVGVFKPAGAVYGLVGQRFGTDRGEVLFVSANGWDVAAAARYGFTAAWVNRDGAATERLPGRPAHVLPDLSTLPGLA